MTTILKTGGLQHAHSLGNIDTSSKHRHFSSRSYDSEDESVGRKRNLSAPYPKPSIYSKADIQEQYCLSERQLNTVEPPRRDGFFGCWSNRGNQQSFLSVCVGRRHPSDENLADYAPFHKYPKYPRTNNRNIIENEDEIENFHFRRRPTSFLCSNDPKRFTWMAAEEAAAAADASRGYRCPSHVGTTTSVTPSNLMSTESVSVVPPRTKHVSFARSHTLTSFEDLSVDRSVSRLNTTKSQERLIGGKKVRTLTEHLHHHHQLHGDHQFVPDKLRTQPILTNAAKMKTDSDLIEKLKRNVKKTQATQTDVFASRTLSFSSNMSNTSPHSAHRTCINGNILGRKLTKSLSEAMTQRVQGDPLINTFPNYINHELLHRTQSEEPPRSPHELFEQQQRSIFSTFDTYSHPSDFEISKSDIFMSDHHTHSRTTSQRSIDSHDIATLQSNNNFIDTDLINTGGCIEFMENATQLHYDSNSLPRRKCFYHTNDYHQTNSLPRRPAHHYDFDGNETTTDAVEGINAGLAQFRAHGTFSLESNASSNQSVDLTKRRYSCAIPETLRHLNGSDFEDLQSIVRRNSINIFYNRAQSDDDDDDDEESESDEYCSTCGDSDEEEDDESKDEKEIFIDFKPSVSPPQSPYGRNGRLQKTMSEGEIMLDKRREINHNDVPIVSTSEEDLKVPDNDNERYSYSPFPIKDESACDKDTFLKLPKEKTVHGKNRREAFIKRSVSLEQSALDDNESGKSGDSKPASPVDKYKDISTFPSSDSLVNDLARDHSDGNSHGNWNESQVTVLQIDPNVSECGKTLLTPSEKRKNLILQHQQRSSMDTEAIEIEEHSYDQNLRTPTISIPQAHSPSRVTFETLRRSSATIPTNMPSIAVTPSASTTHDDDVSNEHVEVFQTPTIKLGSIRSGDIRRKSADPIEPIYSNVVSELQRAAPIVKSSSDQQPFVHHSDTRRATDMSEGSTNTDDYITCTDALSKRVAAQTGSQTLTQNGSSFESASSIYSLARVENICEDAPTTTTAEDSLSLPPQPSVKPSPSHSISSSSSGSYFNGKKAIKSTSPRNSVVIQQPIATTSKQTTESISDDEKSEKRYSSSGYYESPHDDEHPCRMRKQRDWNEDDRRRRKEKMRLDIEKENMKSLTSPTKKPICFKRISPDDRTALHILDGTSQAKTKRIRPKTRRSPRARNPNEDPITRKVKTPTVAGSERVTDEKTDNRTIPSKYTQPSLSPSKKTSPKKRTDPPSETRLKALSTSQLSLRSVSPGSDSVFYSEVDVHCHHCGKEVEIIAAIDDTLGQEEVSANIVMPPADFADSPEGTRQPHRMYKKFDRRLRSEERHGERKHYRIRQESARAKSEERGKDDVNKEQSLRTAGSSPCVVVENSFTFRNNYSDLEQGVYQGLYRHGIWIQLTEREVWYRSKERTKDVGDRRTEVEKDFQKKYQNLTHRLVHRKTCGEMYRLQSLNSFHTDKTVIVHRKPNGEFGFRIHGSKPVVISSIEPETPARSSGLEIGDIILSVNGVPVVDKKHSDVVDIAHAGSEVLELEVARTFDLATEALETPNSYLYSGYLWRQGEDNQVGSKKWIRRWFCLRPDHSLYYFKSDQEFQPVGFILLTNHTVESCAADVGKPFAFCISSPEGPPIYLAADTQEAASRWLAVTSHASAQSDQWLETSTRNMRLPPNSILRPDWAGFLHKLGSRWRTWSKRYCVLKDACLYFYLDSNSKTPQGMVCLQGYHIVIPNVSVGRKYAFELSPPESKLRAYCFSADSDMEKKRWIAALEYSIDRWLKAS
ncbi:uncharacterized protein LOC116343155 isoform X2 [Contarinia nasturtii]|uniref:uncharacterized protein LOC116343155 isoform X2 n=1 Tax=Contarinia nasturtii TaxID=265458 RepID=UPI0012D46F77|nr:uncharacterized protein LOC116343155 isoform X2 [Contarinia nasturtii]